MSTLQQRIGNFDFKLQQFADLLNLSVAQLEELKEVDSPAGNALYTAYFNFMQGIYPSKDFIAQYTNIVAK
jgi:hypothetical protein